MRQTDSFTDQDHRDLDRLMDQIQQNANGVAARVWNTGFYLIEVQHRELFRIKGHETLGEMTKPDLGFDDQQANNYILTCLTLSRDWVQDKRIYLDGLLVIVHAEGEVRQALLKLCPRDASADQLRSARTAGEQAKTDGKDVEKAVADALAGKKPRGQRENGPLTLIGSCEKLLRRTQQDTAIMDKAIKQAQQGQRPRPGMCERLCQQIALLEDQAETLREIVEGEGASTGESQSTQSAAGNRRNLRRAPQGGAEKGPAPQPPPEADRNLFGAANPSKSQDIVTPLPDGEALGKGQEGNTEEGTELSAQELHDEVAVCVDECLTEEEQQQLEGQLYRLLQGRPIGEAEVQLRGLYESCQRVKPGLEREIFDRWLAGMLDTDFDRRWDFTMAFYLTAQLPGFRMHLRLLKTYDLPPRQKQLSRDWDRTMDFNIDEMRKLAREIQAEYGTAQAAGTA